VQSAILFLMLHMVYAIDTSIVTGTSLWTGIFHQWMQSWVDGGSVASI